MGVRVRDPATGKTFEIDAANLTAALEQGMAVETPAEAADRSGAAIRDAEYSGLADKLQAGVAGLARGATLGLSDVAYAATHDDQQIADLARVRSANPTISAVTEIGGGLAPALLSGGTGALGSLARATPAGAVSGIGARILGSGGVARGVAAGAIEGAAQGAGSYVSDVALKNKPLSAEGFAAATGRGALWGGAAGGAFGLAERTLTSARKLFPKQEVTREAAEAAEREAVDTIETSMRTTDAADTAATQAVETIAAQRAATDPDFAAQLQAAQLAKAQAEAARAQQRLATQTELDAIKIAKAKAPKPPRKTRRAMQEPATPAPATPAPEIDLDLGAITPPRPAAPTATSSRTTPPAGDDLEALLGQSVQRAAAGEPVAALQAEARVPGTVATDPLTTSAREASTRVPSEMWHGGGLHSGKIPVDVLRREMGLSQDEFSAWALAARDRGEIELARVDLAGMYSPERTAALDANAIIEPVVGGKRHLVRFKEPPAAAAGPGAAPRLRGRIGKRADDPVEQLVAAADPQAAKIVEAQGRARRAKEDVKAWLADFNAQADSISAKRRAEGTLRRDQDVIHEMAGDATVRPGQSLESYVVQRGRERTSRLRDPYTPDELVERSRANPVFRDLADVQHGAPAELRARMRQDGSNDLAERILSGRTSPAQLEIEELVAEGGRMRTVRRPATGEDVLGAIERQAPDVADLVARALGRPVSTAAAGDLAADLAPGIEAIGRYEAAAADLADALGDAAPAAAVEHAAAFRAAHAGQGDQLAAATAAVADDAARAFAPEAAAAARQQLADPAQALATITPGAPPAPAGKGGGLLGQLADLGAAVEVLQTLGVPGLPDPSKLPLIGPVLGVFLKARAAMSIYRRLGGKVPATAEAQVAGRAAAARERVHAAVGRMLDTGAKTARAARRPASNLAGQLSHRLFDDDEPTPTRRKPANDDGDMLLAWRARVDELARASAPGAIRRAVRARVGVGDPALLDAIVSTQERKLAYLNDHLPRQPHLPTVLQGGRSDWHPSRAELQTFATIVEAADDPAGVLERLADGGEVAPEAADAIRAIYPELFAEARQALLEAAAVLDRTLPYRRRCSLSVLFDAPLDGTLEPSYCAFLQEGYAAPPAPADAGPLAAAPPAPAIAADIALASRVSTDLDRRAGGL